MTNSQGSSISVRRRYIDGLRHGGLYVRIPYVEATHSPAEALCQSEHTTDGLLAAYWCVAIAHLVGMLQEAASTDARFLAVGLLLVYKFGGNHLFVGVTRFGGRHPCKGVGVLELLPFCLFSLLPFRPVTALQSLLSVDGLGACE